MSFLLFCFSVNTHENDDIFSSRVKCHVTSVYYDNHTCFCRANPLVNGPRLVAILSFLGNSVKSFNTKTPNVILVK